MYFLGIEFLACARARHVAYLAEDRALRAGDSRICDGPCNSCVAVGVAAVEFVLVLEAHGDAVGFGGRSEFLRAIHVDVVVHACGVQHLHLRGVAERIVSLGWIRG
jgi:hypothetical protein